MLRKRRQWSDRSVDSTSPLFPGYLFCRFESAKPLIVSTPGVVAILGFGKHQTLPESEIDAIQTILRSGLPAEQHLLPAGWRMIAIIDGPLKGVEGVLVKSKSKLRVVVSITILQRSVAVEVSCEAVKPIFAELTSLLRASGINNNKILHSFFTGLTGIIVVGSHLSSNLSTMQREITRKQ